MSDLLKFGSLVEIESLDFLGTYADSPNARFLFAYGDRRRCTAPADRKWVLAVDGVVRAHGRFRDSMCRAWVTDRGLCLVDTVNRRLGRSGFAVFSAAGKVLVQRRDSTDLAVSVLTPDERYLVYVADGRALVLDIPAARIVRRRQLPPCAHKSIRLVAPARVEIDLVGGMVTFELPADGAQATVSASPPPPAPGASTLTGHP